jgi:acyl carrier protein
MTDADSIREAIAGLLADQGLAERGADISGLALLGLGGVMDSLAALRFITAAEQHFGVSIMDDLNLDCMETADKLAAYVIARKDSGA